MLDTRQLRCGCLGEVGDPLNGRQAGTPLQPGGKRLAEQLRAECLGHPGRRVQTIRPGGVPADDDRRRFAGP